MRLADSDSELVAVRSPKPKLLQSGDFKVIQLQLVLQRDPLQDILKKGKRSEEGVKENSRREKGRRSESGEEGRTCKRRVVFGEEEEEKTWWKRKKKRMKATERGRFVVAIGGGRSGCGEGDRIPLSV